MFNIMAGKRNRLWFRIFALMQIASFLFSTTVWALPQDGTVVGGNSTISQPSSTTMQINQTTDKSIINWQGYSIGANESVQYTQPSSSSISLNRVVGQDPSLIYGQLSANGQVWVINPNGLLVGSGANINVGGLLLSTLNIGNEDFMSGNYKFQTSGQLSAISNQGNITSNGGYVVLISPSITNEGNITANNNPLTPFVKGELKGVVLASADEVTLTFAGNDLIGFTIDKATAQDALGITNTGKITADGGQVILSAKAAGDLLKTVINNEGIIQAQTLEDRSGKIYLLGGMENNAINVGGTLDASAPNGGDGGFIETSAASVKVTDDAKVTTYAPNGKTGEWLIDPTDYNIASGGDITGAALGINLGTSNVTILSSSGATGTGGDVNVNDAVSWSANTLTLTAAHDININAVMTASGTSALALNTATANGADGAVAGGNA
ncbi:MAG: filamentous hemagglutinin N-terminal domain-containing protein, partial [Nitrospirae bacterium]